MDLVIRPSTADDSEQLGVLHVAAWRAAYRGLLPDDHLDSLDPAANAAWRRRSFAEGRGGGVELVAELSGQIAGFIAYGPPRDEVPEGWGELWAINLHPDRWRQGIGSRLLAAGVAGLRGLGYRTGYLWVVDGNERAIAFYRRHGWLADGAVKLDDHFQPPLRELRCTADLAGDAGSLDSPPAGPRW